MASLQIVHAATLTVTNTNDSGVGSLRGALASAVDGDTIDFSITTPAAITLTSGELLVNKSVTITGPGADQLSLSGNHLSRVFHIDDGKTVIISGLTITNGSAEKGAGIYNDGHAALTLDNCTLSGNSAVSVGGDAEGGGIFNNDQATLTLNNCTISGNSASASNIPAAFASGGGIFNSNATLTLDNCTVSGNWRPSHPPVTAGGICNVASGLGRTAATTINNSTLRNNSAFAGGGIFNDAFSAFPAGSATLTINNSTLTGNSADQSGGIHIQSIVGSATVTINNSTLSGNSATGAPGGVFIKGSRAGLGGSTTVTHPKTAPSPVTGRAASSSVTRPSTLRRLQSGTPY